MASSAQGNTVSSSVVTSEAEKSIVRRSQTDASVSLSAPLHLNMPPENHPLSTETVVLGFDPTYNRWTLAERLLGRYPPNGQRVTFVSIIHGNINSKSITIASVPEQEQDQIQATAGDLIGGQHGAFSITVDPDPQFYTLFNRFDQVMKSGRLLMPEHNKYFPVREHFVGHAQLSNNNEDRPLFYSHVYGWIAEIESDDCREQKTHLFAFRKPVGCDCPNLHPYHLTTIESDEIEYVLMANTVEALFCMNWKGSFHNPYLREDMTGPYTLYVRNFQHNKNFIYRYEGDIDFEALFLGPHRMPKEYEIFEKFTMFNDEVCLVTTERISSSNTTPRVKIYELQFDWENEKFHSRLAYLIDITGAPSRLKGVFCSRSSRHCLTMHGTWDTVQRICFHNFEPPALQDLSRQTILPGSVNDRLPDSVYDKIMKSKI